MSPTKFYHVIQILLQMCSCDQSLVAIAFLCEKLPQPQFYKDLTRKTAFFEGLSWFKFNNLKLALGTNLKFYTSVAKGLNLKFKQFCGLITMFVEVTEEKLVKGGGGREGVWSTPILNIILFKIFPVNCHIIFFQLFLFNIYVFPVIFFNKAFNI